MKLYFLTFVFLIAISSTYAQWIQNPGPFGGGNINSITTNKNSIFVVSQSTLFVSKNGGLTWNPIHSNVITNGIEFVAAFDTVIFAGNNQTIYKSINNGLSWIALSDGLPSSTLVKSIVKFKGSYYAAFWGNGIYKISDNVINWTSLNEGLTNLHVTSLAVKGDSLYAGFNISGGVWMYDNNSQIWVQRNNGLNYTDITRLAIKGGLLFAGTNYSLFRSINGGADWVESNTGLISKSIQSIVFKDSKIFVGTDSGVFYSSDNGDTWKNTSNGLRKTSVEQLALCGADLYTSSYESGIYKSTDDGANWAEVGVGNLGIYSLLKDGNDMYAGTANGVFCSGDVGKTWTSRNLGLPITTVIYTIAKKLDKIYIGTNLGIYVSSNKGIAWTAINNGIPNDYSIKTISEIDSNLYAGYNSSNGGGGILFSNDAGVTWSPINVGLPNVPVYEITKIDSIFFACTYSGLFKSMNNGLRWDPSNNGITQYNYISSVVKRGDVFYAASNAGIYTSINQGLNWVALKQNIYSSTYKMLKSNNNIYACGYKVLVLPYNDSLWYDITSNLDISNYCITTDDTTVFIGDIFNGLYKRTSLIIANNPSVCKGSSTTLKAQQLLQTDNMTFSWSNGIIADSIVVTPSVNSTYTVTGQNSSISDTTKSIVTVNQIPTLEKQDATICNGDSVSITANLWGNNTYLWNNGKTSSSIMVQPNITTSYSVTVTDANRCSNSASIFVKVNLLPNKPIIKKNWGELEVYKLEKAFYRWVIDSVSTYITYNNIFTPDKNGSYYVVVIDSNRCARSSDVYNFLTYSIDELNSDSYGKLYPIPSSDKIYIESTFENYYIEIYTELGTKIREIHNNIISGKTELDISSFASGNYYCIIKASNRSKLLKFIKN